MNDLSYFTITNGAYHLDCHSLDKAAAADKLLESGLFFEEISFIPKVSSDVSLLVEFLEGINEDGFVKIEHLHYHGYRFIIDPTGAVHVFLFSDHEIDEQIDNTDALPIYEMNVRLATPMDTIDFVYEKAISKLN